MNVHRKKESKISAKENMRMKQKELEARGKEESLFQITQSFLELCVREFFLAFMGEKYN